MRRGDIWTAAGGKDYAGKPRPVVIVQDDSFDATDLITICAFTTDETDAPLFRLPVQPNERNGLRTMCRLMVDKISTVPKAKVGARVGRLDDEDILRLNQAVLVFLGLAASFEGVSPRAIRLASAIQLANQAIHESGASNLHHAGMGSTIVAVAVEGNLFSHCQRWRQSHLPDPQK